METGTISPIPNTLVDWPKVKDAVQDSGILFAVWAPELVRAGVTS